MGCFGKPIDLDRKKGEGEVRGGGGLAAREREGKGEREILSQRCETFSRTDIINKWLNSCSVGEKEGQRVC